MTWWFLGGCLVIYLIIKAVGPGLFFGGLALWLALLYIWEILND